MNAARLLRRLLLLPFLPCLAAGELDKAIPDHADVYVEVRDWSSTRKTWTESGAYKTWRSAELTPIREWIGSKWDEAMAEDPDLAESEAWAKMKEMTRHFQGTVGLVVMDMDRMMNAISRDMRAAPPAAGPDDPDAQDVSLPRLQAAGEEEAEEEEFAEEDAGFNPEDAPSLALVFALGGDEKAFTADMNVLLDKIIEEEKEKSDEEGLKRQSVTVDGLELNSLVSADGTNLFWTVSEGYGLIGNRAENIALLAGNLRKGGAVKPLASHPEYARATARIAGADTLFFLNLTGIMGSVERMMGEFNDPIPMLGSSAAQLVKKLDLTAMLPVTSALKLVPEGIAMTGDFGFSRETVLSKLFMPYGREKTDLPAFVPADVLSASAMRVNLGTFYESFEVFLNAMSPQAAMFLGIARTGMTTKMGVDLKADILDHLGETFLMVENIQLAGAAGQPAAKPAAGGDEEEDEDVDGQIEAATSRLIAASLKDKAALQGTIDKMLAKAGDAADILKKKEYLGQTYFMVETPGGGPAGAQTVAYAFLGDYLVVSIGDPALLQSAIRSARKPEDSLWRNERIQKYINAGEGPAVSVQVTRIQAAVEQAIKAMEMGGGPDPDMPDMAPLSKLFGTSIGVSRMEGTRLSSDGIFWYADEPK